MQMLRIICVVPLQMNIKLNYLYRDGGNYKNYGQVVFANSLNLPLGEIEKRLSIHLIDNEWFVAAAWQLPELFFERSSFFDLDWHEFQSIEATEAPADSGEISEWLKGLLRHHTPNSPSS